MDLGRVGFDCKMRFFRDNPLEIDVRWFPAPVGAKWFPDWHRFGNGDLASLDSQWFGIGQVEGSRKHTDDFHIPPNVTGQAFLGTLEQYQEGTIFPGVPLMCQDDGQCPGCGPVAPDCAAFGLLHPTLKLTIISVTSTKLVTLGSPGMVLTLTNTFPCEYISTWVGPAATPCSLVLAFEYDKVISSMALINGATIFQVADSQTIHPAFRVEWSNLRIDAVTACVPDNDESWNCVVELP